MQHYVIGMHSKEQRVWKELHEQGVIIVTFRQILLMATVKKGEVIWMLIGKNLIVSI
jgi:hypothetical protein